MDTEQPRLRRPRVLNPTLLSPKGLRVAVLDDGHSDRLRCDHPPTAINGRWLAQALLQEAARRRRGRVVTITDGSVARGLKHEGFRVEGELPGFYSGNDAAFVLGAYPDPARGRIGWPEDVAAVRQLLAAQTPHPPRRNRASTRRATTADAEAIAGLLGRTFAEYPTPSDDPDYVAEAIRDGVPFRLIEVDGQAVACASADLVRSARTAELTDCATDPNHRGNGFMQAILLDLMDDLRDLDYPTAFTLARARIPGMNLAFQRLGFNYCGTMVQSCRIGDGIEDMNIWSRPLRVD